MPTPPPPGPPAPAPAPAPRAPVPVPRGGAGAGAGGGPPPPPDAGVPPTPEKLDKAAMMRLISAQLPGHDEGAAALAEKWNAETKNDKPQVDAAVAAPNLKSELLTAWRTAKAGDDQAFVEEYGSKDPVAVQKFSDINAEAYWDDTAGKGALADAKKGLYQAVAAAVVQYQTERARVFPIMTAKRFNYVFAGKKITNIPDLTRRTHSVGALGRAGAMSAAGDAATLKGGLELIAARSGGAITHDAGRDLRRHRRRCRRIPDDGTDLVHGHPVERPGA